MESGKDSAPKRAVIYIRVSTKQQAMRDGNPEGYSLPTQRQACVERAKQLSAVVVDEYIDKDTGTAVTKRPAMQRLLERIERQRDVAFVIVHKLDRWARNTREDLIADFVLELANCSLVSCSESIDRSAAGRLLHSILASVNEYHSRNMGEEIKRKTLQKVREGGTPGPAPLGYKNVGEAGRRYVVIDAEPARLIQWAFQAYATGEWSVQALRDEVTKRGLRSRGGPNSPQKERSISQLHRICSSRTTRAS
jgi:site-specific DNA recombinase